MRPARTFLQAALAASLLACASARGPEPEPAPEPDPWRPFNHAMVSVNDALDRWLVGPVAKGWIFVTPETVRVHLEQFYDNLNFPGYFVQPLLQGDPKQSGIALARFGVNSTAGLAGFFDPAHHWLGLARRPEDMGQTFSVWGSGPGPYVVLPFLLPASSARDAAGFPIDSALNIGDSALISWVVPGIWPATLLRTIYRRALADEDLRELREASFDWYSAVRDGYLQRREVLIRNDGDDSEEAPSVEEKRSREPVTFNEWLHVQAFRGDEKVVSAGGTFFGSPDNPRIVRVYSQPTEIVPLGVVLLLNNKDRPGIVGYLGTLLSKHNVNIASMSLTRDSEGGSAMTVLNLDSVPPAEVLDRLEYDPDIMNVRVVKL